MMLQSIQIHKEKFGSPVWSALMVVALLIPAARCCSIVYFGIRPMKRALAGRR
jgi:hypothetical protein